ncbi:MAG: sugar phosphate isomerase/epimerase [Actinomycetota bacterium]
MSLPGSAPDVLFSTAAFFTRPLREGMRAIADTGYPGVEVMVTKDPATQEAHLLRDLAREHDLRIAAIHAPFLLISRRVFGTDPIQKIYRSVHLAEEVGAPLVVVHPPYRWQSTYRRWLTERLGDFAARTGVDIAVENMFPLRMRGERGVTVHAHQGLDELERFEHIVLDTSHAAVDGLDLLGSAERLHPRLTHVHVSNNAGKGWDSHLPVDRGVLPLRELLGAIAARGYTGSVALELDIRSELRSAEATRAVLLRNRELCERWLAAGARAISPGRGGVASTAC